MIFKYLCYFYPRSYVGPFLKLPNFSVFSGLRKKYPSHIVHPNLHVPIHCVNLQPDQGEALLCQTFTDLSLIQWDHRDLHPRRTQIITLPQCTDEHQVAASAQEPPDVAQGSLESSQVRTDTLQTEAGHEAVGPRCRKGILGQRLRTVHIDG